MRTLLLAAFAVAAAGCACQVEPTVTDDGPYVPPPESCRAPDLRSPTSLVPCTTGSGVFGQWVVDAQGLPAYDYGLDQNTDQRASFWNTEHLDRRDHWVAFGNQRLNAMAYNDGYVEVATTDRGPSYLNKFDEPRRNFAGGYSWLDDGEATWCSAYKWRPHPSHHTRRFGLNYAESTQRYRGVQLARRVMAVPGEGSYLVDEVVLTNVTSRRQSLSHYEYWDVARRPVEIAWLASGDPFIEMPRQVAAKRDGRNALFDEVVSYDADRKLLGLRRAHAAGVAPPPKDARDNVDYYPGDPFLAVLQGEVSDVYVDQTGFFGEGGPGAPAAVTARLAGEGAESGPKGKTGKGTGQTHLFVVRSDLVLEPGESRTLRFAYGYARFGEPWSVDQSLSQLSRDLLAEGAAWLRPRLFYFAAPDAPALQRELAWHAGQLEVSVGRRDFWNQRVLPQGSAYLYLHGADGASRDLGLFALPLVYSDPELARDELGLFMKVTHAADQRFAYAFQGHGQLDDALGVHRAPSDLQLFFLWALAEYVGATGDTSLLDEQFEFWPPGERPAASGFEHARLAVRHLLDVIGTGPHGLLRVQTGDWNDGILTFAPDRDQAIRDGESVPNTQMALAVLPKAAALVEPRDPALAAELRARLPALCEAVKRTWTGGHFGRAYFGDGVLFGATVPELEAQVWPLLGDCWANEGDREKLIETVRAVLDEPSPAGALQRPRGVSWPAVSALLTAGYARTHPDLAWAHLSRATLAAHAVAFPTLWYGIWSGPDALAGAQVDDPATSTDAERAVGPGATWFSAATPMTDFPTQNNNQHALPLLAALRVAGVEATDQGLRLSPSSWQRPFSLRTQLLDLSLEGSTLSGTYRPVSPRRVEVVAPLGAHLVSARVNGVSMPMTPGAKQVSLSLPPNSTFAVQTAQ